MLPNQIFRGSRLSWICQKIAKSRNFVMRKFLSLKYFSNHFHQLYHFTLDLLNIWLIDIYIYIYLIYLYGVIYLESIVIYFDNNTANTTIKCHKNKLTDSGFQPCCGIFDMSLESLGAWNLTLKQNLKNKLT